MAANASRSERRGSGVGPITMSYAHTIVPMDSNPLRNPFLNKGFSFTQEERAAHGLEGLLPAAVMTLQLEVQRSLAQMRDLSTPLQKHVYLNALASSNATVFYRLVIDNAEEVMPLIYTPVVGEACMKRSAITRGEVQGMFITPAFKGRMLSVLENYPGDIDIIVVSDGSRILGLGDLGADGMGIPVGKLGLYIAAAGFHPAHTLPVLLDFGTENEAKLADPLYIGWRHRRVDDAEYYALVEEFVVAVQQRWPGCLIQWEDFSNNHCFDLLDKYRGRCLSFNDDVQGTGAVIAAGFLVAAKVLGIKISDLRCVFLGAGSAGIGVADRIVSLMVEEGLTPEAARRQFWFLDSKGLVTTHRASLEDFKVPYARPDMPDGLDLITVIREVKPSALVGLSMQSGAFNEAIIRALHASCPRPLIFPLSNPTSKSECSAHDAIHWTNAECLFASGSPFPPVSFQGREIVTGQGNNMFVFPGLGLGAVLAQASAVTDGMINAAVRSLAAMVTDDDIAHGMVYPPVRKIREISANVAGAVLEQAIAEGVSRAVLPAGERGVDVVRSRMYDPSYPPVPAKMSSL
eukprot:a339857_74.p2 GENE.a339857_74~~a339857_74.p2  ORF type:complete len:586 (-),score=275.24 a339857_74:56-1780(-)